MTDADAKRSVDSRLINTSEDYDIIYWSKVLEVSRAQLLTAIEQVGNSVGAVKGYLKK